MVTKSIDQVLDLQRNYIVYTEAGNSALFALLRFRADSE